MPSRKVAFDHSFEEAIAKFGGYRQVDEPLRPLVDALARNPYAFKVVENDFIRCRYAITKPVGSVPALCVMFRIEENGDVGIYDAEEFERY
jgi:hypothetical protein